MFMRFRGGGIGHKATRDWDEFLQREGRVAQDPVNPACRGEPADATQQVDDEDDEEMASEVEEDEEGIEMDEIEHELDRVVADDGEVLDDDILAREGYGAL